MLAHSFYFTNEIFAFPQFLLIKGSVYCVESAGLLPGAAEAGELALGAGV
jgi:hypothetical protein